MNLYLKSLALFLVIVSTALARPPLEKPNIIVVMLDDAGFADFPFTGNSSTATDTPNLARLAREGARFPQFYSGSPSCTSSRYSLLTGRNPARSGLRWAIGPTEERYLHPKEITIADGLKSAGYATAIFGKWHLGTPNSSNSYAVKSFPLAHGFDCWLGTNVSHDYDPGANLLQAPSTVNQPVAGYEYIAQNIATNVELGGQLTNLYGDAAVSFIHEHKDGPFFIYLVPNMTHLPLRAAPEFQGKSPAGLLGDAIRQIDYNVGLIRSALESDGLAQNTLFVFLSDNGPWILWQNSASDSLYGDSRFLVGSALPLRDGKGSTWEGGVRVPGIFWWPGTIPAGTIIRKPASAFDILPTLFGLANVSPPTDRTLDGRDIRPYLNPSVFTGSVPDFTYVYTGGADGNNNRYALRSGPWKIHVTLYSQTGNNYGYTASAANPLLFNVETDPSERVNQASAYPAKVAELKTLLDAFNTSLSTEKTFWDTNPNP